MAFKHNIGTVYGEYLYGTGISGYKDVKVALDVQHVSGGSAAATSIIFLHTMIIY